MAKVNNSPLIIHLPVWQCHYNSEQHNKFESYTGTSASLSRDNTTNSKNVQTKSECNNIASSVLEVKQLVTEAMSGTDRKSEYRYGINSLYITYIYLYIIYIYISVI